MVLQHSEESVYVEAKKSKNFQTYTVGINIQLSGERTEEEVNTLIKEKQAKCRKLCNEQIQIDGQR